MKKVLRWVGLVLAGLAALVVLAGLGVYVVSEIRLNKTYNVEVKDFVVPNDAEAIARGKHILVTRACHDCHGADLGGGVFFDDAPGFLYARNLTSGEGGAAATFTAQDWSRAIRHGLGRDNKPLVFMPATDFYLLSDADLGDLIAYLRSLPPVNRPNQESVARPLGRVLFVAGILPLVPAELIDHSAIPYDSPPPSVSIEYGAYLGATCTGCHGMGYSGGQIPGTPPEWPPAANLTPSGNLAQWSEADFMNTLRTGKTPEGKELDSNYMPWKNFAQFTDDELKALWLFLQSLPPRTAGSR